MALIVCKNCGKKISDTAQTCIHCGAYITNQEPSFAEKVSLKQAEEKETKRYEDLNNDAQIRLEREFLQSDRWAKKYKKKEKELPSYRFFLFFYPGVLLLYPQALSIFDIDVTGPMINENYFEFAILVAIVLLIIGLSLFLYSVGMRIYFRATSAKYVYLKKYQRWLLNEKNIDYAPTFRTNKQMQLFESVCI